MGNQFIILLVVGSLLGMFGGNAISKLNPFKGGGKTQIVKNEFQREEYFNDKIKKIEYRIKEKNTERTPVKRTLASKAGNFVENFFGGLIKFAIVGVILFFLTGINIFKIFLRLRKTLRQVVKGIEKAKPLLNGEQAKLKEKLSRAMDDESKLLVDEIKRKQ